MRQSRRGHKGLRAKYECRITRRHPPETSLAQGAQFVVYCSQRMTPPEGECVTTEKARKRRNEIVIAVFNHVPSIDFEQITIKDLCEAAGISVGTFYHYFGDKSGFFSQVYTLVDDYLTEELLPQLTGRDPLADLALFCSGFAGCAAEFGATMFKSVCASCPYFSDEEDRLRPVYTIPYGPLEKARQTGCIVNASAEELTKALLVLLRGYVYDWSHRSGGYDLVDAVQRAAAIVAENRVTGVNGTLCAVVAVYALAGDDVIGFGFAVMLMIVDLPAGENSNAGKEAIASQTLLRQQLLHFSVGIFHHFGRLLSAALQDTARHNLPVLYVCQMAGAVCQGVVHAVGIEPGHLGAGLQQHMVLLEVPEHIAAVFRGHIGGDDVLHLHDGYLMAPLGQILGGLAAHHAAAHHQGALACGGLSQQQVLSGDIFIPLCSDLCTDRPQRGNW